MRKNKEDTETTHILSATTPEGMENECIALAYELVAARLKAGTATSAETVHFLKMGSQKDRLEKQNLEKDLELKGAKTEALQSAKRVEELYSDAISAMRRYAGYSGVEEEED